MEACIFRARSLNHGFWVYGDLIVTEDTAAIRGVDPENHIGEFPIAPSTLGRRTGLRDASGTNIYEGDIIEVAMADKPAIRHLVKYLDDLACFGFKEGDCAKPLCEYLLADPYKRPTLRIVGNAYDSPDLLAQLSPLLLA